MKRQGFILLQLLLLAGAESLAADPGYPFTLQDASGYALTLPTRPRAIVSLTLASDEILSALVDKNRLAALDAFAADPGISNITAWAQAVPKLAAEKERLIALQPDLVFVADWKEKEFIQTLRDARVPVFVFHTPGNFDELAAAVTQVAGLVGEPARGKALVASMNGRLQAVASRLPKVGRPTVLSYSFSGTTYAKGTSFDALVEKAGLVNAATQAGLTSWPSLSKEQVLALDPDLIVLPSWSYDPKDDPARFLAAFVNDPVFAGLAAVRNKRVFVMQDRHLQSTSQFMVDGVEDLARVGYPALFP